jgi:uncharacterized membrane protein (GlpM family)
MDVTEATARFVAGGALILLVSLLGETKYHVFSGLAVLFPVVTLTGYYFLAVDVTLPELRETVLFSILGVPTVWGFTVGFYVATAKFSVPTSLLIGIGTWFVVAFAIVLVDSQWTHFAVQT